PALKLFISSFEGNMTLIQNNSSGYVNRLRVRIDNNESLLPEKIVRNGMNLGISFSERAKNITNKNKGIITKITDSFGFIRNAYGDYYFKVFDLKYDNPVVGDKVIFELRDSVKGPKAVRIKDVD
ncbi:TPA: hypothetical protein U0F34_003015, partial [Listeria monocytogenes]|nr:hypothetical protein [Listeria monocytogenes]